MTEEKLKKKVRKLAKWARKNGFSYVSIFAMAPNDKYDRWYVNGDFIDANGERSNASDFFTDVEVANG